ncbi:MAG: ATP-dependent DNA helicase [Methyloligellaceae bacterium]
MTITPSQPSPTDHEPGFPPDFEAQPGVREALQAIDAEAPVVFVLGRAGTGKTTFVRYLKQQHETKPQVILAPTGVAALNAGGQTIHSFFWLPPRLLLPDELKTGRTRRLWRQIGRIIVDEVSMVRVDVIDAIDLVLRRARESQQPFGGVQMVFVGDFLQLPPVTPAAEAEMLYRMEYESPFAFSARALDGVDADFVRLHTIHRQTDPDFIDLLGGLRDRRDLEETLARLNERCVREHRPEGQPMLLCGTNARADHYNREGLDAIAAEAVTYTGRATGTFDQQRDRLPVPETLVLKPGARVMAVKNDLQGRWVNGSLATVDRLEPDCVGVRLDGSSAVVDIERRTWEKIQYRWDDEKKRVVSEAIGSYAQIPLILAWAATIHKAQGLTLDDVRIDLERGAFASGQAYVALSRARSLEGLSLTRSLRATDVLVDPVLAEFDRRTQ